MQYYYRYFGFPWELGRPNEDQSRILVLTGGVLVGVVDDDVADLLGALGVGQKLFLLLVAVDIVVAGGAGGGEEGPDEVHGGGGEGAAAETEEEAGDDDEDVFGAVLRGRGGLPLVGGEGLGAADLEVLVRAEAADAEDGDEGGCDGGGIGGVRVGLGDGGEGDKERLRVAAGARVGGRDEGQRRDGQEEEEAGGVRGGGHGEADLVGNSEGGCRVRWGEKEETFDLVVEAKATRVEDLWCHLSRSSEGRRRRRVFFCFDPCSSCHSITCTMG
jgi:hypothetical protein